MPALQPSGKALAAIFVFAVMATGALP